MTYNDIYICHIYIYVICHIFLLELKFSDFSAGKPLNLDSAYYQIICNSFNDSLGEIQKSPLFNSQS